MIPATRIEVVLDEPAHLEAHVARARKPGFDVVDRWPDGWACTCYAWMKLEKRPCAHINSVQAVLGAVAS